MNKSVNHEGLNSEDRGKIATKIKLRSNSIFAFQVNS